MLKEVIFENDNEIQKVTDEDWKSKLTPEQYEICRNK
jgi:hypothetical protein